MTTTDYILDSALVLMVLLQIKEKQLTMRSMIRPLVILSVAVFSYLHGIPTSGNDLVLVAVFAIVGGAIGAASGRTLMMRPDGEGNVLARAGWASGGLWVLGMGARFAFVFWISHSGVSAITNFSATHAISGQEAWTVALLAMAVFEVCCRTGVVAFRRHELQGAGQASFA